MQARRLRYEDVSIVSRAFILKCALNQFDVF
jgi:hypothetical protein